MPNAYVLGEHLADCEVHPSFVFPLGAVKRYWADTLLNSEAMMICRRIDIEEPLGAGSTLVQPGTYALYVVQVTPPGEDYENEHMELLYPLIQPQHLVGAAAGYYPDLTYYGPFVLIPVRV